MSPVGKAQIYFKTFYQAFKEILCQSPDLVTCRAHCKVASVGPSICLSMRERDGRAGVGEVFFNAALLVALLVPVSAFGSDGFNSNAICCCLFLGEKILWLIIF